MRDIIASVPLDVDSDAETYQDQKAQNATKIDGIDLELSNEGNQTYAVIDFSPQLSSSAAELSDKIAAEDALL